MAGMIALEHRFDADVILPHLLTNLSCLVPCTGRSDVHDPATPQPADAACRTAEITITQSVSRRTYPFTQLFDNFLILGWVEGFEPSATGTTIQRSTS